MDSPNHLQKVKDFHDKESPQYTRLRYHDTSCEGLVYITRKKLILDLMNHNSGEVLDIGCGPGILTQELLNRKHKVFSTDLSFKMIKNAKEISKLSPFPSNAHFAVNDASTLCFSDSTFNAVLCIGVMYYVLDYNYVLDEIKRILKPDGIAIIQINKIIWPSIYEKCIPLYQYCKSKLTTKKYNNINFKFNIFSYKKFIKDMEKRGFYITELSYFDFRIPFMDLLFPKLSLRLGKIMFNTRHSRVFKVFSHALLIKAYKRR